MVREPEVSAIFVGLLIATNLAGVALAAGALLNIPGLMLAGGITLLAVPVLGLLAAIAFIIEHEISRRD